jgi:hypothetical protein
MNQLVGLARLWMRLIQPLQRDEAESVWAGCPMFAVADDPGRLLAQWAAWAIDGLPTAFGTRWKSLGEPAVVALRRRIAEGPLRTKEWYDPYYKIRMSWEGLSPSVRTELAAPMSAIKAILRAFIDPEDLDWPDVFEAIATADERLLAGPAIAKLTELGEGRSAVIIERVYEGRHQPRPRTERFLVSNPRRALELLAARGDWDTIRSRRPGTLGAGTEEALAILARTGEGHIQYHWDEQKSPWAGCY